MIITEIHIYGYGKLENLIISDLQNLQVFYGENEAGKSTIMSFIHSILFGFPTKQQAELRYEPKKGAKYGGRLKVNFPERGNVIIERMKGKAIGDVRVQLSDGTIGDEDLLKELLFHVDKSLYQSIFSFNLQGLQNIQQMKNEDIGRFLFSAGALGTDQLLRVENTLQKELDTRFKPSGKKPLINEKLKEIKQTYNELKKVEQKNEQYWLLIQEIEAIECEIKKKQNEQLACQNELNRLEMWKQVKPLIEEELMIKSELETYEELQFPIEGKVRLERIEERMKPLEAQLASIEQRMSAIKNNLQEMKPNKLLLHNEQQIMSAVESVSLFEKWQQEEVEAESKLQELIQLESILREKLHVSIREEEILTINTSIFQKERVEGANEKYRQLASKKINLDEKFNEAKQLLEEAEEKIKSLKSKLLSESERAALKEKMTAATRKTTIELELSQTEERLAHLIKTSKKEMEKARKKKKNERMQYSFFCFLFVILSIWGFWRQEWLLIMAGAIGLLFSLGLIIKGFNHFENEMMREEIKRLEEKKRHIIEKLRNTDFQNITFIESELERDRNINEQLRYYEMQCQQRNEQYEKVLIAFEVWEKDMLEHEQELKGLREELLLPNALPLFHIAEAFQLIEQLKTLIRDKQLTARQKNTLMERKEKLSETINHLCMKWIGTSSSTIQESAYLLRKSLKEEMEKQIIFDEKTANLLQLEEDFQRYYLELEHYKSELKELLQLAKVETVETFRELSILSDKKISLENLLIDLQRQIKHLPLKDAEFEVYRGIKNIDEVIKKQAQNISGLKENIPELQSQLAEKKYEIQMIEEGGRYAELLHKYKQMKADFEGEAREWAKYAIAKEILDQTIESFKKERLPNMLKQAEEFLSFLTDGNYVRIYQKQEGSGFLIESKEHILFEANELSQATAEQIYVSFRLALTVTIYQHYSFPIIIDDSFVNFDEKRTRKVMELLKGLSGRQILFFTCHKHLLPNFSEGQIAYLNKEIRLSI